MIIKFDTLTVEIEELEDIDELLDIAIKEQIDFYATYKKTEEAKMKDSKR